MRFRWLILLMLLSAAWMFWWVGHNPLPDGYQNEYLLIGNAWDLWGALIDGDHWHVRWYAYTGYWPFGLYVLPWPFMALLGPTREALLLGNLVHLWVLLWAANDLGRRLQAPLAAPLVLLCPGVFGPLVRFEPNLAAIAWTAAGLAFLVRSEGLRHLRPTLGFGCALGIGLMMDRLTVTFFLLPAAAPVVLAALARSPGQAVGRVLSGLLVALLWAGAYYREFFLRHADELLSQAPVGEIDAAGHITATEGPLALLYYPLALLDSQAGPVLGLVFLIGFGTVVWAFVRRPRLDNPRAPLLACIVVAGLFFTLVAKKQVFYTLPLLVPLAILAARHQRLALVGLVGGLWSFGAVGLGILPGGPWLPQPWVAPRHIVARPPTFQDWPLDDVASTLTADPQDAPEHIAVLSQDSTLFEGFVLLALRQALPQVPVRGIAMDPAGTYEHVDALDSLVWVGRRDGVWPSAQDIDGELRSDHLDPADFPPVAAVITAAQADFTEVGRWQISGGNGPLDVVAYRRR